MTWTALIEECATGDRNLFLRLAPPSPSPVGRMWNHLVSRLADGPAYLLLALYTLWMQTPQALAFCLCLAGGFMLELPLYKGIKQRCKRPRPCNASLNRGNLMHIPDEYSFPSGHTAGAFVLAGNLAAFYPPLSLWAYLFAVAVGYSRVYNRLHFPADILAGALLGTLCSALARLFLHPLMGMHL
ncbi:MAG: phosphatase PAP2 family protein [Kiritimatiellae bacterium]|jgi:undecaprenyl-diphosphatase|nr:phosphatase PAP2 family protein [Kiritimatiellia bacterium]